MSQGSSSGTKTKCQHCNQNSHLADGCPFVNTKCKIPGCKGVRKLLVSIIEKNPNRKFLKCHLSQCNGFQWLDHAILASHGYEVPDQGCYIYGDQQHWMKDCKWHSIVCGKNGCKAKKVLRISTNPNTQGRRYLKCYTCKVFEWVNEDVAAELLQPIPSQQATPIARQTVDGKGYSIRVVNDFTGVDGLCVTFETKISLK